MCFNAYLVELSKIQNYIPFCLFVLPPGSAITWTDALILPSGPGITFGILREVQLEGRITPHQERDFAENSV